MGGERSEEKEAAAATQAPLCQCVHCSLGVASAIAGCVQPNSTYQEGKVWRGVYDAPGQHQAFGTRRTERRSALAALSAMIDVKSLVDRA